ncbi:MAG: hypothetical protein Kow0090_10560 [Myxococcota bacterium]
MTISEIAEVYSALGFDFIAVTDHDHLLRPDCYEKQLAAVRSDLLIFKGVELTIFEKGYLHINKIEGDGEALYIFNHPSELGLSLEKVLSRIESVGKIFPLNLVEITSKGFYTPEYDISEIPYPKVATDDAHTRIGCGRAWVEVECERDKDSIIRALKRGDFKNCFNTR